MAGSHVNPYHDSNRYYDPGAQLLSRSANVINYYNGPVYSFHGSVSTNGGLPRDRYMDPPTIEMMLPPRHGDAGADPHYSLDYGKAGAKTAPPPRQAPAKATGMVNKSYPPDPDDYLTGIPGDQGQKFPQMPDVQNTNETPPVGYNNQSSPLTDSASSGRSDGLRPAQPAASRPTGTHPRRFGLPQYPPPGPQNPGHTRAPKNAAAPEQQKKATQSSSAPGSYSMPRDPLTRSEAKYAAKGSGSAPGSFSMPGFAAGRAPDNNAVNVPPDRSGPTGGGEWGPRPRPRKDPELDYILGPTMPCDDSVRDDNEPPRR